MRELRIDDATVRFRVSGRVIDAVDHVDLVVPRNRIVGLVGESGSGKSTLARALVGLVPLSGGSVLLDGVPVHRHQRGRRRPIQMVFQDPHSSLDPRMPVAASIAEAVDPGAWRRRAAVTAEVTRLMELVGLDPDRQHALPASFSGGQRQRVALARALAARPEVLVADEITSALDVSVQGAVLNLVRHLHRDLGLTMLFISHDIAVVRYVSEIIAVMHSGRIVEVGPTDDLLTNPRHEYTRTLLASVPQPVRKHAHIRAGETPVSVEQPWEAI